MALLGAVKQTLYTATAECVSTCCMHAYRDVTSRDRRHLCAARMHQQMKRTIVRNFPQVEKATAADGLHVVLYAIDKGA